MAQRHIHRSHSSTDCCRRARRSSVHFRYRGRLRSRRRQPTWLRSKRQQDGQLQGWEDEQPQIDTRFYDSNGNLMDGIQLTWIDTLGVANKKWSYYSPATASYTSRTWRRRRRAFTRLSSTISLAAPYSPVGRQYHGVGSRDDVRDSEAKRSGVDEVYFGVLPV